MVTVLLISYLITAYSVQSALSNKQWQPTNCKVHWAEAVSCHLENDLYSITIYCIFNFYYFYCRKFWCCRVLYVISFQLMRYNINEAVQKIMNIYFSAISRTEISPPHREWMDVLSPPIIHPRQQQTESKGNHSNMSTKGVTLMLLSSELSCALRKVWCVLDVSTFYPGWT